MLRKGGRERKEGRQEVKMGGSKGGRGRKEGAVY